MDGFSTLLLLFALWLTYRLLGAALRLCRSLLALAQAWERGEVTVEIRQGEARPQAQQSPTTTKEP